jgi:hypothetical protein
LHVGTSPGSRMDARRCRCARPWHDGRAAAGAIPPGRGRSVASCRWSPPVPCHARVNPPGAAGLRGRRGDEQLLGAMASDWRASTCSDRRWYGVDSHLARFVAPWRPASPMKDGVDRHSSDEDAPAPPRLRALGDCQIFRVWCRFTDQAWALANRSPKRMAN